jgi:hypothetical protein
MKPSPRSSAEHPGQLLTLLGTDYPITPEEFTYRAGRAPSGSLWARLTEGWPTGDWAQSQAARCILTGAGLEIRGAGKRLPESWYPALGQTLLGPLSELSSVVVQLNSTLEAILARSGSPLRVRQVTIGSHNARLELAAPGRPNGSQLIIWSRISAPPDLEARPPDSATDWLVVRSVLEQVIDVGLPRLIEHFGRLPQHFSLLRSDGDFGVAPRRRERSIRAEPA